MSVRDEIARATAEAMDAWAAMSRVDEPAQTVERWVADALLPIVERVAREVGDLAERKMLEILASGRAGWLCGLMPHEINDIVSRVMEGGQ